MSNKRLRIDWDMAKRQLQEAEVALESALIAGPERIDRAYRERATQMAARHTRVAADVRAIQVLVFSLGAETYGLPVTDLAEVLPSMKCTPVPRAASELAGVINLRGELRSVIDLRRLFSLPAADDESGGRILMIRSGLGEVGLKVGPVDRVQSLSEDNLASPEAVGADGANSYFKGLSPDNVIVLNTAALLSHPVFRVSSH
ncbi:MAG: chemotaxis protein CheW [Chthoniobacteraceae bacterium]